MLLTNNGILVKKILQLQIYDEMIPKIFETVLGKITYKKNEFSKEMHSRRIYRKNLLLKMPWKVCRGKTLQILIRYSKSNMNTNNIGTNQSTIAISATQILLAIENFKKEKKKCNADSG